MQNSEFSKDKIEKTSIYWINLDQPRLNHQIHDLSQGHNHNKLTWLGHISLTFPFLSFILGWTFIKLR